MYLLNKKWPLVLFKSYRRSEVVLLLFGVIVILNHIVLLYCLTMHGEVPEFKRCCCCLPLRRGLVGFGYVRMVLDILLVSWSIFMITWLYPRYLELSDLWVPLAMTVLLFLDVAFSGLLVVAGHLKNTKLFRVVLIYCVVYLVLDTAFGAYILLEQLWHALWVWHHLSVSYRILDISVGLAVKFAVFFVQVYIILLIRSEEKKLRGQSIPFQFVNNATESEAVCVCAGLRSDKGLNTVIRTDDEDDVMQNMDDDNDVLQYIDIEKSTQPPAINKYLDE